MLAKKNKGQRVRPRALVWLTNVVFSLSSSRTCPEQVTWLLQRRWKHMLPEDASMRRMYELAVPFEEERFQRESQLPRFQQTQPTLVPPRHTGVVTVEAYKQQFQEMWVGGGPADAVGLTTYNAAMKAAPLQLPSPSRRPVGESQVRTKELERQWRLELLSAEFVQQCTNENTRNAKPTTLCDSGRNSKRVLNTTENRAYVGLKKRDP
eukprot:COSAG01_NODE_16818_length_1201_cov_1.427405_1_plen_208_part_00